VRYFVDLADVNLRLPYGRHVVVNIKHLAFKASESFVLSGPSGSGKSSAASGRMAKAALPSRTVYRS
jgi:ABC-type bacteriocin/lantibiotic exporter with double-glycine peptidase domain